MSKPDPVSAKKEKLKAIRWFIAVFIATIVISALISFGSEELMSVSGTPVTFVILLAIILLGIVFDVVGVAVTSADEKPFHSMAARKVPGAHEAIALLRNAEKVGSICNDVIGDICGVVSGAASATIAARVLENFEFSWPRIVLLAMSALVAGVTVGGKAIAKGFAINSNTRIVHFVGRVISWFNNIGRFFCKK